MNKYVEYCENSLITEAWAVITGIPGEIRDSEVGALENNVLKKIDDLKVQPTFVVQQGQDGKPVPPFWQKQLSWENGKYLSRIGHRYLSVHFIKKENEKYKKYENSLEPQIKKWLVAYEQTVSGQKKQYPLGMVGFGYINIFKLPEENFDLSRYFRISFGTGAESAKNGLAKIEINFMIVEPKVDVKFSVYPEAPGLKNIIVVTRVEARKIFEDDFSFEDNEKILDFIRSAKETAKDVFFDLATEKTHKIMEAKYASSTSH